MKESTALLCATAMILNISLIIGGVNVTEGSDPGPHFPFRVEDEQVLYSTLFGGTSDDEINDAHVDDEGYIYITGSTRGGSFPVSNGTYGGGYRDAFVAKFDPKCEKLIFSRFLGGSGSEEGTGITVDSDGYVYLTGFTTSGDFPTTEGAFNRTLGGLEDIFVTKFEPDGSNLVYSTLIGGSLENRERSTGIVVDDIGSASFVGWSRVADYPVTNTEFSDAGYPFVADIVVTKLDPSGSDLVFSRKIGGSGADYGMDIEIDEDNNHYITGYTTGGEDFPVTEDVFDNTSNHCEDVFVMKLSPGGTIIFSTFVGGDHIDKGFGIAVDDERNIYVTGVTEAKPGFPLPWDFPLTSGAYMTTINGTREAFVFKLNKWGNGLDYSTLLGGTNGATGVSISLDESNNAYVGGIVVSDDYPTTYGAYFRTKRGGVTDSFLTVLNGFGTYALYSSYFGGDGNDDIRSVEFSRNNTVVMAGFTKSSDFPVSSDCFQSSGKGGSEGFVSNLNLTTVPSPPRKLSITHNVTGAELNWDPPMFDGGAKIIGYNIYRSMGMEDFVMINSSYSDTLYVIRDHDPLNLWRFRVTAVNRIGESAPSNIVISDDIHPPSFIIDHTSLIGYTGDPHDFSVEVYDNIGVDSVHVEVFLNQTMVFNTQLEHVKGNLWAATIILPHSIIPLSYSFNASDHRGNINMTSPRWITIFDNDPPEIVRTTSPEFAYTGSEYQVECEIIDNIKVEDVFIEISGIGHDTGPISMEREKESIFSYSYNVPLDNINDMKYRIAATDGNNTNMTQYRVVPVLDNVPPVIIQDHCDVNAFTGKYYHMLFEIVDNIGVSHSWCIISPDNGPESNLSLENYDIDLWRGRVALPDKARSLSYQAFSIDLSGNTVSGNLTTIPVIDVIVPVIVEDGSDLYGYTGKLFEFCVTVTDNIGIESVEAIYRFGDGPPWNLSLEGQDIYYGEISIPLNSIDPLFYAIRVIDFNGNLYVSDERNVTVVDIVEPELIVRGVPDMMGTGEEEEIKLEMYDNVGLGMLSVMIDHLGNTWHMENLTSIDEIFSWKMSAPLNLTGDFSLSFKLFDSSGNHIFAGPYLIVVEDIIPPTITHVDNITAFVGELIRIDLEIYDNIGIDRIEWSGVASVSSGDHWEGSFDRSGEYRIMVTVYDGHGNSNQISFTITVIDNEKSLPFVLIVSVVLVSLFLMISIVTATLFFRSSRFKGNKMQVGNVNVSVEESVSDAPDFVEHEKAP